VYHTINCPGRLSLQFWRLWHLRGTPVINWDTPELGDEPNRAVYIWKYHYSIMFQRHVNDLQSNYYCPAQNCMQRWAFLGHLQIPMSRFWWCPVHVLDNDPSIFSFTGEMNEPVECCLLTDMYAMDCLVLCSCNTYCTIRLCCNILSPMHFLLQLCAYEPFTLLDQRYMSEQASRVLQFLGGESLQVVVHQLHCDWVDE